MERFVVPQASMCIQGRGGHAAPGGWRTHMRARTFLTMVIALMLIAAIPAVAVA